MFKLKLCDMHLIDLIQEFTYYEMVVYPVEWEVRKTIKWLTVYYNKTGITDCDNEMDPYAGSLPYVMAYYDSLDTKS